MLEQCCDLHEAVPGTLWIELDRLVASLLGSCGVAEEGVTDCQIVAHLVAFRLTSKDLVKAFDRLLELSSFDQDSPLENIGIASIGFARDHPFEQSMCLCVLPRNCKAAGLVDVSHEFLRVYLEDPFRDSLCIFIVQAIQIDCRKPRKEPILFKDGQSLIVTTNGRKNDSPNFLNLSLFSWY